MPVPIFKKIDAFRLIPVRDFSGFLGQRVYYPVAVVKIDPFIGVDAEAIPIAREVARDATMQVVRLVTRYIQVFFRDYTLRILFQPSGVFVLSQVVRSTSHPGFDRAIEMAVREIGEAYIEVYRVVAQALEFILAGIPR